MVQKVNKKAHRKIEEKFFETLNVWLIHNDTVKAERMFQETAELLKSIKLKIVFDFVMKLKISVSQNSDRRELVRLTSRHIRTSKHSFMAMILCLEGYLYLNFRDYPMAAKSFRTALSKTPFQCKWEAYQALGIAYYHVKDLSKARESLLKSVAYDEHPHPGAAWLSLGEIYWRLGDDREAERAYKKASRLVLGSYQRDYVRFKMSDIGRTSPVLQDDVLTVNAGNSFTAGILKFNDELLAEKIVNIKNSKYLEERSSEIIRDYEMDIKARQYLERFSPQVVGEILRQYKDLKEGQHRGRLLEEQICRRRQMLTCLKISLKGFTAHFRHLDPEEQITFINEFLKRVGAIVFRHNGGLDRLQTTNVIAYFGYMNRNSDIEGQRLSALDAINAAFDIEQELIDYFKYVKKIFFELPFEKIKREKGRFEIRERKLGLTMGISSGYCNFGEMMIGDSNGRIMVGNAINISHRLTEIGKPREILTSQKTYDLVSMIDYDNYDFKDFTGEIELDSGLRQGSLKDYENLSIYKIIKRKPVDEDDLEEAMKDI